MTCLTPDCAGEPEPLKISHSVLLKARTVTFHQVPVEICPDCGDLRLVEETWLHLEALVLEGDRAPADGPEPAR